MNKRTNKLQTRDFISIGIFSLIYAVVAFVIGGIAQMTPMTFPFMPMIVALFTGTVFMPKFQNVVPFQSWALSLVSFCSSQECFG